MSIRYTSKDSVMSGMPVGGIGAGTMQIYPDGTRRRFTGMNNWEKPLGELHWFRPGQAGDYAESNPFAIFVKTKNSKVSKLLQTKALDDCPTIIQQPCAQKNF